MHYSPILSNFTSKQLFVELTRVGYALEEKLEVVNISKHSQLQDLAKVTLVANNPKQLQLQTLLLIINIRLIVSLLNWALAPNNAPESLTTILVGLPIKYFQFQVIVVLHKLLGPKNEISVTYSITQSNHLEIWMSHVWHHFNHCIRNLWDTHFTAPKPAISKDFHGY
jgi:hypothetical protein